MAISNSYVKLSEGILHILFVYPIQPCLQDPVYTVHISSIWFGYVCVHSDTDFTPDIKK